MTNSPVGGRAISCLLPGIRVERDVRDRLDFGRARLFVPKPRRYEPKRRSVVLPHFGGRAKDAEEDECMDNVDPFIPHHYEHGPRVGAPCAGWCLHDGTER